MDFIEAVREAEKGKKIRIKQWVEGRSIMKFGWFLRSSGSGIDFHPSIPSILSDDWEVEE